MDPLDAANGNLSHMKGRSNKQRTLVLCLSASSLLRAHSATVSSLKPALARPEQWLIVVYQQHTGAFSDGVVEKRHCA